jgi:hypothetical protein
MITLARIAQGVPGKLAEFIALAKEIAALLKSKHGVEAKVILQHGGPVGRICRLTEYKDFAAYEEALSNVLSDPEYHKLLTKLPGLVIPGSATDSLWRSV